MKIFRLALHLLGLASLSGCCTYNAIQAANNPPQGIVYEHARAEKAAISNGNQLLIFLKGSIANSPSDSLFTLVIPFAEIEGQAGIYRGSLWHRVGTNEMSGAILAVQRGSIHDGWLLEESSNAEMVPLGPPISPQYAFPNSFAGKLPDTAKLLTNSKRALYQVGQDDHLEFIYIDASYKRTYTDLQLNPDRDSRKVDLGYYLLLPLTVPLDVATAPIQIPFFIFVGVAMGHSGC